MRALRTLQRTRLAIVVLFLSALQPARLYAQSRDACTDPSGRQSWEDKSSPVYSEATELARALTSAISWWSASGDRNRSIYSRARRARRGSRQTKESSRFGSCRRRRVSRVWRLSRNGKRMAGTSIRSEENHGYGPTWIAPSRSLLSSMGTCCSKSGGNGQLAARVGRAFQKPCRACSSATGNWPTCSLMNWRRNAILAS